MMKDDINNARRCFLFKAIPSVAFFSTFSVLSKNAFPISFNEEVANLGEISILGNPIKFNGMHKDAILKMAHLGNGYRLYNQLIFRFNCHDSESPFGGGGVNAYVYCIGDPLNFTDPTGHVAVALVGGVLGAAGMAGFAITTGIREVHGFTRFGSTKGKKAFAFGAAALSTVAVGLGIASVALEVEGDNSQAKTALAIASVVTGMLGIAGSFYRGYAANRFGRNDGLRRSRHMARNTVRYNTGTSRRRSHSVESTSDDIRLNDWTDRPQRADQANIQISQSQVGDGAGNSMLTLGSVPFTERNSDVRF
ncbi:RHS repeat-associated core domain-containing protein [Aeromonas jandaei]|uniref:RHS repeat-associated core domain-containing protein n=1 Tax=Aeromonas jandaei TaxID=650 RepID=UPI001ABF56FD|nr:RHS repeat-associated core domain-containing protein [Aeromonas jandaei]QSR71957.1 RHS repeat-associated core domain-containing protein [Aeromonas jandaei]